MQVHCISVSEYIWVGGGGPRGVGELPAGGIRASQGTFSGVYKKNYPASPVQHIFMVPVSF